MIAKGQILSDRYQIVKSIGEGGMANVFLAYDTILERNVAVKILRGDLSNDEKFVRRFQREALSASSLSHPNIVEVYDVGEDNGEYYIVMEFVQGKHLKNLLKKRGKLTLAETIDIMLQVTSGLEVAHDSYIIHRDIKPQNIMILENGLVKLTDFGIAVAMNSTQLTQTNSVMGSVHYLPPEQASGKGATLQSDIYSLGILMYELLSGKLPYRGDNAVEIALKHLKEKLPSIREEVPDLPQSVENIIIRATAKNPKNRYADAREMHEDLKTCLDPARNNEAKITLKYPETEYEEGKVIKTEKKEKQTKKESEEIIAKQITQNDIKSQNRLLITLASIFACIMVLVTTVVILLPKINASEQIKIPNVVGKSEADAIEILQDAGLEIKDTITESSSTIESGKVTRTSPVTNRKVKKGTEVTLYVSLGTSDFECEDYRGQSADYVKGTLEAKGIKVLIEKKEVDADANYDDDEIIDQDKEDGTIISEGDTITLFIPEIKNKYPDFTDGSYSVSDILDFAEEYSLTVTFKDTKGNILEITSANASEYADVTVKSQNRTADSKVVAGVKLVITLDVTPVEECSGDLC